MNDKQGTPPPKDDDDKSDAVRLPKSPEELQEVLRAIQNGDGPDTGEDNTEQTSAPSHPDVIKAGQDLHSAQKLPRSETELRDVVREIVQEVMEDVEAVRQAAFDPVDVVTIPQLMIPRLQLTPRQIFSAVVAAVILIGAPITWAVWPSSVELPEGAVGLWTTITPSYSDVAFRLTPGTLTFHLIPQDSTSPPDSTFHDIVRVQEAEYLQEEGTTEYTVYYRHYRDEYEWSFLYREEPDTTIRFVNQKEMTWRKGSS